MENQLEKAANDDYIKKNLIKRKLSLNKERTDYALLLTNKLIGATILNALEKKPDDKQGSQWRERKIRAVHYELRKLIEHRGYLSMKDAFYDKSEGEGESETEDERN